MDAPGSQDRLSTSARAGRHTLGFTRPDIPSMVGRQEREAPGLAEGLVAFPPWHDGKLFS
jgi:hypothetical protein